MTDARQPARAATTGGLAPASHTRPPAPATGEPVTDHRARPIDVFHDEMMARAEVAHRERTAAQNADRAAVLLWAADRYEKILASASGEHSSDPRYYQGVHDVVLGLRRLAGEAQQDEARAEPACGDSAHRHTGLCALYARVAQQDERCTRCRHPKRDHDGRADHRAKYSPLVAGDPWCHACNTECDYAREVQQDPTQDGEELPPSSAPLAAGLPLVKGNCPACHGASLFLGNGGYVTCSRIDCPEPDAATTVLEGPAAVARFGQPDTDEGEELVHVGWWCWRGDNHGHLATMACRSDNVPIHVPAEWANEMRVVIQRIEDGDEPETD